MDEIEKIVPPILTIIACVKMYGVGDMFSTRDIVIVRGINIITAKILFRMDEKTAETIHNIIIKGIGFPLLVLIAITAKN